MGIAIPLAYFGLSFLMNDDVAGLVILRLHCPIRGFLITALQQNRFKFQRWIAQSCVGKNI